jgi:GT2 family glycosyltransferase
MSVGLERVKAVKAATGYEHLEFVLLTLDEHSTVSEKDVQSMTFQRSAGLYANLNRAAEQAKGEFLLFLDGALQPLQSEWLAEMLMFAQQAENGAVGGKLFLSDGNTIDRTAYVLRAGREPLPEFHGHSRFVIGNSGLERIPRNVSAISCQAMLLRRAVFEEFGGFDEGYIESYGDIDFCLRLLGRGYAQVFTPYAELRFLEDTAVQSFREADATVYRDRWQGGPADRLCHEGYEREVKEETAHG